MGIYKDGAHLRGMHVPQPDFYHITCSELNMCMIISQILTGYMKFGNIILVNSMY